MSHAVVCTLAEGSYHTGVAVLANSLYAGGYRGELWVGHRGMVPPYLGAAGEISDDGRMLVTDDFALRFVPVETKTHLAHHKPTFLLRVLREAKPDSIFYFDPDIVSVAPWTFYQHWSNCGIATCEDCTYPRFPATHPFRHEWGELARSVGLTISHLPDAYYNSGFVGLVAEAAAFLKDWEALLAAAAIRCGADLAALKAGKRADPFYVPDQDTFNIAVMTSRHPISSIGPDGMGFTPAGFVMHHAVDTPKPWKRRYLRDYLRTGDRVTPSHRAFWQTAGQGPLRPFTVRQLARQRVTMSLITGFGRFYRR